MKRKATNKKQMCEVVNKAMVENVFLAHSCIYVLIKPSVF